MTGIVFTAADVEAFAQASHDRNPLHCDPEYARATPFGRPIVHGMAAVVRALGVWSKGRPFRLLQLHARFRRALHVGVAYELDVKARDGDVEIRYAKGSTTLLECAFAWGAFNDPIASPKVAGGSTLRREPAKFTVPIGATTTDLPDQHFVPAAEKLDDGLLGLACGAMPAGQLAALLWSSYMIGMEVPGRQALFTECTLVLGRPVTDSSFTATDLSMAVDSRFNLVTINGRGTGVDQLLLRAFVRPAPVRPTPADVDELRRGDDWTGRSALVSGSGRGFGATLAFALARRGARVAVNGRTEADIERVVQDIRHDGGEAHPAPGDVALAADAVRIAEDLAVRSGGLDLLVNNASPLIGDQAFLEQSVDEIVSFVATSIAAYAQLTRALLPLIRPGGLVVNVTTAYLSRPRTGVAHYLSAKGAIEGLTGALAAEFPAITFVAARLPRMLTDQTNVPFDLEPKVTTVAVANALLDRLSSLPTGNYHLVDVAA